MNEPANPNDTVLIDPVQRAIESERRGTISVARPWMEWMMNRHSPPSLEEWKLYQNLRKMKE